MVSLFSLSQETQRYLRSLIGLAQNGLGGLLDNVLLGHGRSLGGEVGIADPASVDGGDKFIDVTQRILGCFGRGYIERGIGSGGPLLQEAILARIARAVSLKIFGKAQIIGKCHIGHAETKLVSTVGDAALQAQLNMELVLL